MTVPASRRDLRLRDDRARAESAGRRGLGWQRAPSWRGCTPSPTSVYRPRTLVDHMRRANHDGSQMKRRSRQRRFALTAVGIVAFLPAACSSAPKTDEGVAVRFTDSSPWPARVLGCASCGSSGIGIVGDPDGKPQPNGVGAFAGWTETLPWPVAYTVVVRGATSACPPAPSEPSSVISADELQYVIDSAGKCVLGSVAWTAR